MKSRRPSTRRSLDSLLRRLDRSNTLAEARAQVPAPKDMELRRNAYEFAEMWNAVQQLAAANEQKSANPPSSLLAGDAPSETELKKRDTQLVDQPMAATDDGTPRSEF